MRRAAAGAASGRTVHFSVYGPQRHRGLGWPRWLPPATSGAARWADQTFWRTAAARPAAACATSFAWNMARSMSHRFAGPRQDASLGGGRAGPAGPLVINGNPRQHDQAPPCRLKQVNRKLACSATAVPPESLQASHAPGLGCAETGYCRRFPGHWRGASPACHGLAHWPPPGIPAQPRCPACRGAEAAAPGRVKRSQGAAPTQRRHCGWRSPALQAMIRNQPVRHECRPCTRSSRHHCTVTDAPRCWPGSSTEVGLITTWPAPTRHRRNPVQTRAKPPSTMAASR